LEVTSEGDGLVGDIVEFGDYGARSQADAFDEWIKSAGSRVSNATVVDVKEAVVIVLRDEDNHSITHSTKGEIPPQSNCTLSMMSGTQTTNQWTQMGRLLSCGVSQVCEAVVFLFPIQFENKFHVKLLSTQLQKSDLTHVQDVSSPSDALQLAIDRPSETEERGVNILCKYTHGYSYWGALNTLDQVH